MSFYENREDDPLVRRMSYDRTFIINADEPTPEKHVHVITNGYKSINRVGDDTDSREIVIEDERKKASGISSRIRNVILAILNIAFNVGMNVSLPIYAGTMDYVGGDAYVLLSQACLWFVVIFVIMTQLLHFVFDSRISLKPNASYKILFIMGLLTTLNGILIVYASPPDRTPPYLQGLLSTMSIPFTVICRIIGLRKGINLSRSVCVSAVMIGLFITAMPQLWGLPGSGSGTGTITQSTSKRILWPLCFVLGFLPYGIMNVICEKELKKGEGHSFSFITWSQIFQVVTMYMMFWSDFIPGFGMAASPSDFTTRLRVGWHCAFSTEESCHNLIGKQWLFFVSYCLGNLFQFLLIQYAEGAVYAAVVQACISPLAALFWTLFKFDVVANNFYWKPEWNETTWFTLVGVCIIIPGVVLYNHFSVQEEKEANEKARTELTL